MATPICEDEGILQEWAPELRLLNQIPLKAQRGLFSYNLKLQCIDAITDYIALGTNCGLVYWYCRKTAHLDRLRIENSNCSITCVNIISTVDYMVAAGTDVGSVTVFQIPIPAPGFVSESLRPKDKQIQRFTIDGLHNAPITCLEWSQNGMKLFSGDKRGAVVYTSFDFNSHISQSTELLNEQFEVVQLSYYQQILLVSTVYRTIICDGNANWRVRQVGTKQRKILGKFGATFCKFEHGPVIYASRPGLRLWLADRSGNVEQTLIFQSDAQARHPKIPLINPVTKIEPVDINFGKLLQFGENNLVTYQSEMLYILHPGAITVVASLNGARRILDVAANKDEIFVLEGERSLLRLGHFPDPYAFELPEDTSEKRRSFILDNFATKIKDTAVGSLKRITSEFLPQNSSEEVSPPAMADEALDLPPIVNLPKGMVPLLVPDGNVEIHESIDGVIGVTPNAGAPAQRMLEPEEAVIFRPGKRRKAKKTHHLPLPGPESESDTTSTASEDRLVSGVANELSVSEESPTSWSQSQSSFSVLRDINCLLHVQPNPPKSPPKTPEDKSQASIDTCESASEHMILAPDTFQEEQDRTFFRLANQEISMLDSYNSERTENMSISINLTPSSSASSKLSDNLQSSEISENVSMASENGTSTDSQSDCPGGNDDGLAQAVKQDCENLPPSAETSSASSGNSQNVSLPKNNANELENLKGDARTKWNKELILSQILGLDFDDPLNRKKKQVTGVICDNQEDHDPQDPSTCDCQTPLVDPGAGTFIEDDRRLLPESDKELEPSELKNESIGAKSEESSLVDPKLPSLSKLSYGPPSGSSMLSSCHPSLEINSGPAILSNPQALVVEKTDRWLQYKTPENIHHMAVCNNYVVFVDSRNRTYYSELSGISLSWAKLDYKATELAVSSEANLLWILGKNQVVSPVSPSPKGPFSGSTMVVASNVRTIAVDCDIGYFVRPDGQIKCQKYLEGLSSGPTIGVYCEQLVASIACRNGVLVAITSDENVICKVEEGSNFQPVQTPIEKVTSIALGPGSLLWVVDEFNNIFFSDDYLSTNPLWWQVLISEYIFRNPSSKFSTMHEALVCNNFRTSIQIKNTCVIANDNSVWIYNKYSSSVYVNKLDFTGYIWREIHITLMADIKWATLTAEGVFEEKGHLWLLSTRGDLFTAQPAFPSQIQSVPMPSISDIICIASAQDTLWVLCRDGNVHARQGLNDYNPIGTAWKELRLPQLADKRLQWIACGCDVAWTLDLTGRVFITPVPPHDIATDIFDPAWLEVEGDPKGGAKFTGIFVGPHMHMVWAIDNKRRVYVREGIFPHYQIGTGWVLVEGIEALHLSISSTAVWAMTPSGEIYRRYGISESNYIGDYWHRIPGTVQHLSATFTDDIWGLSAQRSATQLLRRRVFVENGSPEQNISFGDCPDWEVVE